MKTIQIAFAAIALTLALPFAAYAEITPEMVIEHLDQKQPNLQTARTPPVNAAFFGLEVGYATRKGVASKLENIAYKTFVACTIVDADLQRLAPDMPTLKRAKFCFDTQTGFLYLITLEFDEKTNHLPELSTQYPLIENQIDPASGEGIAVFEKGDSKIQLETYARGSVISFIANSRYVRYEKRSVAPPSANEAPLNKLLRHL